MSQKKSTIKNLLLTLFVALGLSLAGGPALAGVVADTSGDDAYAADCGKPGCKGGCKGDCKGDCKDCKGGCKGDCKDYCKDCKKSKAKCDCKGKRKGDCKARGQAH